MAMQSNTSSSFSLGKGTPGPTSDSNLDAGFDDELLVESASLRLRPTPALRRQSPYPQRLRRLPEEKPDPDMVAAFFNAAMAKTRISFNDSVKQHLAQRRAAIAVEVSNVGQEVDTQADVGVCGIVKPVVWPDSVALDCLGGVGGQNVALKDTSSYLSTHHSSHIAEPAPPHHVAPLDSEVGDACPKSTPKVMSSQLLPCRASHIAKPNPPPHSTTLGSQVGDGRRRSTPKVASSPPSACGASHIAEPVPMSHSKPVDSEVIEFSSSQPSAVGTSHIAESAPPPHSTASGSQEWDGRQHITPKIGSGPPSDPRAGHIAEQALPPHSARLGSEKGDACQKDTPEVVRRSLTSARGASHIAVPALSPRSKPLDTELGDDRRDSAPKAMSSFPVALIANHVAEPADQSSSTPMDAEVEGSYKTRNSMECGQPPVHHVPNCSDSRTGRRSTTPRGSALAAAVALRAASAAACLKFGSSGGSSRIGSRWSRSSGTTSRDKSSISTSAKGGLSPLVPVPPPKPARSPGSRPPWRRWAPQAFGSSGEIVVAKEP